MFVVPAIYGLLDPSILEQGLPWLKVSRAYSAFGLVMLLIGMLSIWLGFDIARRGIKPSRPLRRWTSETPSQFILVLAYVPIALIQILLLMIVGTDYSQDTSKLGIFAPLYQPILGISDASILIIAFLALAVFQGKGSVRPFLLILFTQVGLELASGFRSPIIFIVAVVGITAVYSGIKITRGFAPFALLIIPTAFTLPMNRPFRESINDGNSITNSIKLAFRDTWSDGLGSGFSALGQNLAERQTTVSQMPGVILQRTPSDFPFLGWVELLKTPGLLIPRALWPSKPELNIGIDFSHDYLNFPPEVVSSSAVTLFGEGYMYAGWAGTILVSLVIGVLIAFVYKLLIESDWAPVGIALFPHFLSLESQYLTMAFSAFQSLVVFVLLTRFLSVCSNNIVIKRSPKTRETIMQHGGKLNFQRPTGIR